MKFIELTQSTRNQKGFDSFPIYIAVDKIVSIEPFSDYGMAEKNIHHSFSKITVTGGGQFYYIVTETCEQIFHKLDL